MKTLNLNECSKKEIKNAIEERITEMHHMIGDDLYPELMKKIREDKCKEAQDHMRVKHYQAIDRINMYIAYKIMKVSFYDFKLIKVEKRSELRKIYNTLMGIEYNDIRNLWHKELKEVFYALKEARKIADKLNRICVVARVDNDKENGFVSLRNNTFTVVKNIADATEFVATGETEETLDSIKKLICSKVNCNPKVFFNAKMTGRHIYQH